MPYRFPRAAVILLLYAGAALGGTALTGISIWPALAAKLILLAAATVIGWQLARSGAGEITGATTRL